MCRAHTGCSDFSGRSPVMKQGWGSGRGGWERGGRTPQECGGTGRGSQSPGFWVPRAVPTLTASPLLSCLPGFLPALLPNAGFSLPGQRIPSAAGPFPERRGRGQRACASHPSPRRAPALARLLGSAPRPTRSRSPHRCPLSAQDTREPGDPRTSPQCSGLRRETESRQTPICFCDLFCRETRRPAIARGRRQTHVPCGLLA